MSSVSFALRLAFLLFLATPILGAGPWAEAEIRTEVRSYQAGETALQGYLAWDDSVAGPRPGILVIHEWWGHDAYVRQRAEQLAAAGYTAIALDMYGAGRVAEHPRDAQRFMEALLADLQEAERRFEAGLRVLREHSTVDKERTAVLGYCLGGGLALYMGAKGADVDAVVSFHGALGLVNQAPPREGSSVPPMMVFTGGADPMVPGDQVAQFVGAMVAAEAEVSLTSYPGVEHAFTVPEATARGEAFGLPLAYDAQADADSWRRTLEFLGDRLARP